MLNILIGIIIAVSAAVIVGLITWAYKSFIQYKESNHIYKWLVENTSDKAGKQFRSTRAISSWNNLTEERVAQICSADKRIFLSTGDNEDMWGIYEHMPRSVYEERGLRQL